MPASHKNMLLEKILRHKREEIKRAKTAMPQPALQEMAERTGGMRDLTGSLTAAGCIAVIAEVKHASPLKGVLRSGFCPLEIALSYEQGGADAISVLTDERFFQGKKEYLTLVKNAVELPVLRKDFIIDEYQLYESRAIGADAVLLIVSVLDDMTLNKLLNLSGQLDLDALVEVHDHCEMERALDAGAVLIGINNRDLRSFQVNLETTFELAGAAPGGIILVSESGINTREDMRRLETAGIKAALVGESLMRSPDIRGKLLELKGFTVDG